MTRDEVDAFFANPDKRLPAAFTWRETRPNERRATQRVEAGGALSMVSLEVIMRMQERGFLIVILLAPTCIARLCLGGKHRDALTRELITAPHVHKLSPGPHKTQTLPADPPDLEIAPSRIITRDEAFAWFLEYFGIESPLDALRWPDAEGMI